MPKNIVICADGTGNSTIKGRGTNVFKLYEAVDLHGHERDPSLTPQIAFYHDGVGTERLRPLRILSGAFGWGLGRNVRDLYLELVRTWDPGDQIFLFGFSRGAFTARTLAGLITTCGIVKRAGRADQALLADVKEAYRVYRLKYRYQTRLAQRLRRLDPAARAQEFQVSHAIGHEEVGNGQVTIRFVGVWDTVDAVGLPDGWLSGVLNGLFRFKFPDYRLSPHVERACHALALDDERDTFHPLLWREPGTARQLIEQVWFAGVHSNVGGGYPKQGLSLVTLDWMMTRAEEAGLRFSPIDRNLYRERQNVNDKLYDSRSGFAFYYRYKPRDVAAIARRCGIERPRLHVTALKRVATGTEGYAPGNIPGSVVVVGHGGPENVFTKVETLLQAELKDRSLLAEARSDVALRRWSHLACLLGSLALVLWTLHAMVQREGWVGLARNTASALSGGGLALITGSLDADALRNLAPIIVLGVAGYVIGAVVERRMKRKFSEFWRRRADALRDAVTGLPSRSFGQSPPEPARGEARLRR